MSGLNEAIVLELRWAASQGKSVPDLLNYLFERLGPEAAYRSSVLKYFKEAFHLPLRAVTPIGGWSPHNQGEISDEAIQSMLYPPMLQTKAKWLAKDAS
jgi:hypothetical protein